MATFEELRRASNAAFDAGDEERAANLKADALQAREFETLRSQSNAAFDAGDEDLALELKDQALSIQKGMTESAFTGIGRGIKAAPVTMAQGLLEIGAAGIDASIGSNYSRGVTESFEEFKKNNDLNPNTAAGEITEEIVAFGLGFIPIAGWLGRAGSVAKAGRIARPSKSRFLKSAESFGDSAAGRAMLKNRTRLAGTTALAAVGYETLITPDGRATLSDSFDVFPDFLKTEEDLNLSGSAEGGRKLRNKLRSGFEAGAFSLGFDMALPVVGGVARGIGATPVLGDGISALARGTNNAFGLAFNYLGNTVVGEKIGRGYNKYLTASGGVDAKLFEGQEDTIAMNQTAKSLAVSYFSSFDKELSKFIGTTVRPGKKKNLITAAKNNLEHYLDTGDTAFLRIGDEGSAPLSAEAIKSAKRMLDLNVEHQDRILVEVESEIDRLSEMVSSDVPVGDMPTGMSLQKLRLEKVRDTIRENLTANEQMQKAYLRRRFDVHENPLSFYKNGIDESGKDFAQGLNDIEHFIRQAPEEFGTTADPAAVSSTARNVLYEILGLSGVKEGMSVNDAMKQKVLALKTARNNYVLPGSSKVDLATDMFIERKALIDSSDSLKRLMGMRNDVKESYINTIDDLSRTVGGLKFYRDSAKNVADGGLTMAEDAGMSALANGGRPTFIRLNMKPEDYAQAELTEVGSMARTTKDRAQTLTDLGYVSLGQQNPNQVFQGNFGDLSGVYAAPEVYSAITTPGRLGQTVLNEVAALAVQAKGLSQKMAIIPNPLSQVRNILGNIQMIGAQGLLGRDLDFFDTFAMHAANMSNLDDEGMKSMTQLMGEMGLRDSSLIAKTLKDLQEVGKDLTVAGKVSRGAEKLTNLVGNVGGVVPLMQAFEKVYAESDSFFKVMGVLGERSRYGTAIGKAVDINNIPDDVKQTFLDAGLVSRLSAGPDSKMTFLDMMSAQAVKETMPMYNRIGNLVRNLDRIPILGNFTSFAAENIRNSANTLSRGMKELGYKIDLDSAAGQRLLSDPKIGEEGIRNLERSIRGIGSQRLTSYLAVSTALPYAATRASMIATGTTQEEMDAAESLNADYTKGHQLIVLNNDHRGKMQFADQSYVAPFSFVTDPVRAALQVYQEKGILNKSEAEKIASAAFAGLSGYAEPFGSESLFFERLRNALPSDNPIGRGGRTPQGAPIWDDTDDLGTKISRGFTHVMGGFEPAYIREIVTEKNGRIEGGRAFRAATDTPTGTGVQYNAEAELARAITGFTPIELNLRKDFNYKGSEYLNLRSGAKTQASRAIKQNFTSSEDMADAWGGYLDNLYRAQSSMYAKILAARQVGLSDQQIRKELVQKAGLGAAEANIIMRGEFYPGMVSKEVIKEVALEVREDQPRVTERPDYAMLNRLSNERMRQPLSPVPEPEPEVAEGVTASIQSPVEAPIAQAQQVAPAPANPAPTVPAAAPVQQAGTGLRPFIPSTLLGDFRNMDIARRLGMGQ
jgi:hypothetical protein